MKPRRAELLKHTTQRAMRRNERPPLRNVAPKLRNQFSRHKTQSSRHRNQRPKHMNELSPHINVVAKLGNELPPLRNESPPLRNQLSQHRNQESPQKNRALLAEVLQESFQAKKVRPPGDDSHQKAAVPPRTMIKVYSFPKLPSEKFHKRWKVASDPTDLSVSSLFTNDRFFGLFKKNPAADLRFNA